MLPKVCKCISQGYSWVVSWGTVRVPKVTLASFSNKVSVNPTWILAARQLKPLVVWELADVREENNIRLGSHFAPKSRKWTFSAANEQISIRNTRICTSSTTSHYDLSSWMNIWSESWNSLVDWRLIKLLSSNSTFITHGRIWTSAAWKTPCNASTELASFVMVSVKDPVKKGQSIKMSTCWFPISLLLYPCQSSFYI